MSAFVERDEALKLLLRGAVVAVPTDTVYGVAASLAHPTAVRALFDLKRRPLDAALPVMVDSIDALTRLGAAWPTLAQRLARAFWPGPLTIVVAVPHALAALVGSAVDTAGFRIPGDESLRAVLAQSGPLAVSSANEHGEAPCRSGADVRRAFLGSAVLAGVWDDGERAGEVSSVVEVDEVSWRLHREGAIDEAQLTRALARRPSRN